MRDHEDDVNGMVVMSAIYLPWLPRRDHLDYVTKLCYVYGHIIRVINVVTIQFRSKIPHLTHFY